MESPEVPSSDPQQELLRCERLLSDLSAYFNDVPTQAIDSAIEDGLARIVKNLDVDRSTLFRLRVQSGRLEATHSYAAEGVPPIPHYQVRQSNFWMVRMALANRPVIFERLADLPPEAEMDLQILGRFGLKSHVLMPIVVGGQFHGGLAFGTVLAERRWSPELLGRLRLLADVFGAALTRQHAQDELDGAFGFERVATRILASLALAAPGKENEAIGTGLREIGFFMEADEVALWNDVGGGAFEAVQRWVADGFSPVVDSVSGADMPWIVGRLAAGGVMRLSRIADLPPEASIDRLALQELGVQSLLVVPIMVLGRVAGALSIASVQPEIEWPDALTPGVSLLAGIFASLHAREAAERRKAAAEIEAAQWRERLAHIVRVHTAGEMSVAFAHEITQPLGAIENYALAARRWAGHAEPDMPRVIELLDKVIAQSTRAADVLTRMRSLARRHEFDPKPIDVVRAASLCIAMVKMDCEMRDIRVRMLPVGALPLPFPMAMAEEIHVQQVLLNLLRNAMEAIEQGGAFAREITVSLERSARDEIAVQVADRGKGIADADLERIFEPFYSTKSTGLGVGLALCRKLIEAHGGVLWAAHNAGGGAVLRFTLPAVPGHTRA